jgi:hypothetical protein
MIKIYDIEENNYGYILTNSEKTEKLILYKSKIEGKNNSPYYLTKITPTKIYLSGMFYQKKQNKYNGKTKDGIKITITIKNNLAFFDC